MSPGLNPVFLKLQVNPTKLQCKFEIVELQPVCFLLQVVSHSWRRVFSVYCTYFLGRWFTLTFWVYLALPGITWYSLATF